MTVPTTQKADDVPIGWTRVNLGNQEFFDLIMGQSPSSETYTAKKIGLPFLQGNADFGAIHPNPKTYCTEPMKIAEKDDVLISVRAPVGEVNIATERYCIGRGLGAIRPKDKRDSKYLYYYLNHNRHDLERISAGSTFKAITKDDLEKFLVTLPTSQEKQKILSILITVDDAIQRSRKATAETERFKAGVMQELMTKGIGHTEFKEDEVLGKIPKEWDAVKFESAMIHPPNNGIWKNQEKPTNGYRLVRMTEFFKGDILDVNCSATIDLTEEESKKYSLDSGDLLFGRRSLNVEGAGKCVLVPEIKKPLIFESSLIRVALNKKIAYPLFFLYFMNGKGREQISKMVRKVSVSGITGKDLQNIIIPLPPITEQQNITSILTTTESKLSLQRQRTAHYEHLKQGLMNELLTGRRRVKVT